MASRTAFHEVKELEAAIARTRDEQARLLAELAELAAAPAIPRRSHAPRWFALGTAALIALVLILVPSRPAGSVVRTFVREPTPDTLARRRACVHGDRSACLALPCDCTHRLWLQMRCEDLHDREACAASRQP